MRPEMELKPEFVEFIPDELNDRTLYVAAKYRTVVHLCCCGCGRKVVTPLSPAAWKLTFDGVSITLRPSIGSWNLPCKSHYFINSNRAVWVDAWTQAEVEQGRAAEARERDEYYAESSHVEDSSAKPVTVAGETPRSEGVLRRLWRSLRG
jgi:hypothetical protein